MSMCCSQDAPSLETLLTSETKESSPGANGSSAAKKQCLQRLSCDRLVLIDSTWSQAKRIAAVCLKFMNCSQLVSLDHYSLQQDKRLADIPRVQLKQAETLFWRLLTLIDKKINGFMMDGWMTAGMDCTVPVMCVYQ